MSDSWMCGEPGPEGPCAAVDPQCCVTHAAHYGPQPGEEDYIELCPNGHVRWNYDDGYASENCDCCWLSEEGDSLRRQQ